MKVLIIYSYSTQIGSGHLKRCQIIAKLLQKNGRDVSFLNHLENNDFNKGQDLTIFDSYLLDYTHHKSIQTGKILLINDFVTKPFFCDYLLDYTIFCQKNEEDYRKFALNPKTQYFLGAEYFPLDDGFYNVKNGITQAEKNCLIFMTGGNCHKMTLKACMAAVRTGIFDSINVVIGKINPHLRQIEAFCLQNKLNLLIDTQEMPRLISQAQLCIGSFGVSTFERLFLGKKTLGVILAQNQIKNAQAMEDLKCAINLGWYKNITQNDIENGIKKALAVLDITNRVQVGTKIDKLIKQI